MDIDAYESNSLKSREEKKTAPPKNLERVVTSEVKHKKKSIFEQIFVPDDIDAVKTYIVMDVIVPKIKSTILGIIQDGAEAMMYGESGAPSSSKRGYASKVSYGKYYEQKNSGKPAPRQTSMYDFEDVVIDNKGELLQVIDRLTELIDQFGAASVADLNELIGITGQYTDNDYGWTDVSNARVVHTRDGYTIKMPTVMPLPK